MPGGLGGKTQSSVEIPAYIEEAAQRLLPRADQASRIGYTPYYGPDVAGVSSGQQAAFSGMDAQSAALGLPTSGPSTVPQAQDFGGVMGLSSGALFDDAVSRLERERPGQAGLLAGQFADPQSGLLGDPLGNGLMLAPVDAYGMRQVINGRGNTVDRVKRGPKAAKRAKAKAKDRRKPAKSDGGGNAIEDLPTGR